VVILVLSVLYGVEFLRVSNRLYFRLASVPSSFACLPKPTLKHHETHRYPNKICSPLPSSQSSLSSSLVLSLFVCQLFPLLRTLLYVHAVVDGLSIPFFSIARHTLTVSRSLGAGYKPDRSLWVRRDAPRANTGLVVISGEGASAFVAEGP
jgi:hypothetical protein